MPRIDQVLDLVKRDYSRAQRWLRQRSEAAERSANESKYLLAAAAYALAKILAEDDNAWERFKSEEALARQTRLNRDHCLRYALMYMYGAMTKRIGAVACDHERKLRGLWESGASARKVYEELQERSFSGLEGVDKASPATGLRGRKSRPVYLRAAGCRKLDALGRDQYAVLVIKKVSSGSKNVWRSENTIDDPALVTALRNRVLEAERSKSAARGRRRT